MTDSILAHYTLEQRPWTMNSERSNHWTKVRAETREWREAFGWLGLRQKTRFVSAHIVVTIVMKPPLADTGNAYGAIKAGVDGLVDAGTLPGDGPNHVLSLTMVAPVKAAKGESERLTLTLIPDGVDLDLLLVPLLLFRDDVADGQ